MISARLGLAGLSRPPVLLALAAHPDDVEIGAGGTLLRLAQEVPGLVAVQVVLTGDDARCAEARAAFAAATGGRGEVRAAGLRDGYLPGEWARAKDALRELTQDLQPDLVLAPRLRDAHQDHRVVGELAGQVFRAPLRLHYEVPKRDGDLGPVAVYVPLGDDVVERKCALLAEHYRSQAGRDWFDPDVFRAVLRLRGTECGARWAEGFVAPALVLAP